MVNVHVCNIGISSIHGKELLGQLSFHQEYKRPHIETNVRLNRKICLSKMRSQDWKQSVGKIIHGNICP